MEGSEAVRRRVEAAASTLRESPPLLGRPGEELLARAVDSIPLSARGRARVSRVAATIAALAGDEEAAASHVAEALSYRVPSSLALAA
jgi:magnesium chelatase family protein